MNVPVDAGDLRRLVDLAARTYHPDDEEVLQRVSDARQRAQRLAGQPVTWDVYVGPDGLLAFGQGGPPRYRWDALRRALIELLPYLEDPATQAIADGVQAFARNVFDRFGLTLADEETLFVTYLAATLVVELTRNAFEKGQVGPDTLAGVGHVAQSLALSLVPYLPPEARP